jgi:RimJ/RimL family protein N-acetyltransferase
LRGAAEAGGASVRAELSRLSRHTNWEGVMATANVPPNLEIRPASPEDAAECIEHVDRICEEFPEYISLSPGELGYTVEQEAKLFADTAASDNSCFLVTRVDGRVVGFLNYTGGKRRTLRHAAVLGISIRKAWCDRGIGAAMMRAAIAHAKAGGVVKRIELQVFTHNERAIALYRKLGFVEEGRRRRSACRDGRYFDDLVMALLFD